MAKGNSITSSGSKRKAPPVEKPIMFAFCLKPRGLDVPNKGPKHRSQKKYRVSGHAVVRDQDRVHTPGKVILNAYLVVFYNWTFVSVIGAVSNVCLCHFARAGRRFNSFTVGDEKATYFDVSPENSDNFSMLQTSTKSYLPSDAGSPEYVSLNNDASDFDYYPKPCKNKSEKIAALMPLGTLHVQPSYNQRTPGKRNGLKQQNMYLPDWPSQKHPQAEVYPRHENMELGAQDLDEFGVRKASGAAKRASIIARLKRNKAQELLSRADFAMQVAVSAIMDADAVKASYGPSN